MSIAARVALAAFTALLAATATAGAQPAAYVGAAGFADIRQFGSTPNLPFSGDDFSLNATGAGGGLRIGTFLHPRWSLELSVDATTRTTVDLGDPVVILIFPPPPQIDLKASTRFVSVSTMVGFHPPAMGRVRLGYLAGFSFVRGTYESDYAGFAIPDAGFLRELAALLPRIFPPPVFTPRTITRTHNAGAFALGFEAAVDVAGSLALVPEVRALAFSGPNGGPGVFLIRPGVGIRWRF